MDRPIIRDGGRGGEEGGNEDWGYTIGFEAGLGDDILWVPVLIMSNTIYNIIYICFT